MDNVAIVKGKVDKNKSFKVLSTSTLSNPNAYDLMDFLSSFPHGGNARFIKTEAVMEIKKLEHPIGLTVLPKSKNIVIGLTKKNEVHMYDPKGENEVRYLQTLQVCNIGFLIKRRVARAFLFCMLSPGLVCHLPAYGKVNKRQNIFFHAQERGHATNLYLDINCNHEI